jgi:hypothetical protein
LVETSVREWALLWLARESGLWWVMALVTVWVEVYNVNSRTELRRRSRRTGCRGKSRRTKPRAANTALRVVPWGRVWVAEQAGALARWMRKLVEPWWALWGVLSESASVVTTLVHA